MKRIDGPDVRVERVGREILGAAASNEEEAEAVAASPFLYARLRSRIAAERARREESEGWRTTLAVLWRAAPAMALVAVFTFILSLSAEPGAGAGRGARGTTFLSPGDVGVDDTVFDDVRALSSDEVLASILGGEESEGAR